MYGRAESALGHKILHVRSWRTYGHVPLTFLLLIVRKGQWLLPLQRGHRAPSPGPLDDFDRSARPRPDSDTLQGRSPGATNSATNQNTFSISYEASRGGPGGLCRNWSAGRLPSLQRTTGWRRFLTICEIGGCRIAHPLKTGETYAGPLLGRHAILLVLDEGEQVGVDLILISRGKVVRSAWVVDFLAGPNEPGRFLR